MIGNVSSPVTAGMSGNGSFYQDTASPDDYFDYYFENYVSIEEIARRGLLGDIGPGEWYLVYCATLLVLEQVVSVFGVLGNILTLYIMSQPVLSHSVTSVLFRYLTVADLLRLLEIVLFKNPFIKIYFNFSQIGFFCKVQRFVEMLCSHTSSCALILISIERLIAVCFPFKVKQLVTKERTLILLVFMTAILIAVDGFLLFVSGVIDTEYGKFCDIIDESIFPFFIHVYPWIDMILYFFLPFLIVITCNTAIVFTLGKQKFRKSQLTQSSSEPTNNKISSVTRMMLFVSLAFLVMVSPYTIYLLFIDPVSQSSWTTAEKAMKLSVYYTLAIMASTNHAINFILYCGSMPKFREELRILLRCKRKTKVGPVQSGSSGKQDQSQSKETKDTFVVSSKS